MGPFCTARFFISGLVALLLITTSSSVPCLVLCAAAFGGGLLFNSHSPKNGGEPVGAQDHGQASGF